MSKNLNLKDFLFERRETTVLQTKYNLRRTLSSDNSSSSDDSFDDSFEQMRRSLKKPSGSSTNSDKNSVTEGESIFRTLPSDSNSARDEIDEEECDELDEMFKNIDLNNRTRDNVPLDWLENDEIPLPNTAALSTVYEGSESKYYSSIKSRGASTISKDSCHLELSRDSLVNLCKPGETSKDSLDRSFVTSNNGLPIELNDTLEDVELVFDEKNRYLLKPVARAPKTPTSNSRACPNVVNSPVIVIESSSETSIVTAQSDMNVIDVKDIKTEVLSEKSSLLDDTLLTIDSNNSSLAQTVSITNQSFTTAKNDLKLIDTDDYIKSELSSHKTSTASDGKSNSWSTLDLSVNTSTAPITDKLNDSFLLPNNELKLTDNEDIKSEMSSQSPLFTCISYPKTASFFELDEDKSVSSDNAKSSEYYTAAATNDSALSTSQPSVSAARYNTLDDIPSFSTDSTVSSSCQSNMQQNNSTESSKQFNDSLERIEYMMQKGRELQAKSNTKKAYDNLSVPASSPVSRYKLPTPKTLTSSTQKRTFAAAGSKTPSVKAKLFTNSAKKPVHPSPHQAVTPATRILKPFNRVQSAKAQPIERKLTSPRPSPNISPAFKKPNFPTPSAKKEPIPSRIPTSKNKHFEHIVSPIGAYIKNIAAPPLLTNVKPTSDFFDSSYCNKMSKEFDFSVMSDAGAGAKQPVSSLPVKFFTSSEQQRVIDEKFQKIPGGEKMNRIIGQIPSVISHQGRIHSDSPVKRIVPIDDSFANVSVMSGDISVQVVRDVKRH